MSVEIEPAELGFHRMLPRDLRSSQVTDVPLGPFTSEVSQTLKIRNPNHAPVAFKVSPYRAITHGCPLTYSRSKQRHPNSMCND